jgi:hypothetical protein
VRQRGIEDDLRDAVAVAYVDEDEAAVIATPIHPAVDFDELARVFGAHGTARDLQRRRGSGLRHARAPL